MTTDQLIDAIAREATTVVPTSSLRGPVMNALDDRILGHAWPGTAQGVLAAMAVVAAGVAIVWQAHSRFTAPTIVEHAVTRPFEGRAAESPALPIRQEWKAPSLPERRSMSAAAASPAEEPGWQSRAVAPLVSPTPLDSGQPAAVVGPLLEVEALATEPLELRALTSIDPVATGGA